MKYTLSYLLIFCLILILFTACGEAPESPTDAVVSVVASQNEEVIKTEESSVASVQAESLVVSQRNEQEQQETVTSQNQQEAEPKKEGSGSALAENKEPSKVEKQEATVSKDTANSQVVSNNDIKADQPTYIPPSFTSVEGFHSWLQTGGIEEEKRANLLSNVKNSTTYSDTTYCQPKLGNGNELFTLTEIKAYPYCVIYRYGFVKDPNVEFLEIKIYVESTIYMANIESSMKREYDRINQPNERVFDKYGETNADGITYQYYHYPANDSTTIYWKIEKNTFKANYYGDYAQINEILPLLELEQVEYKVADHTVIE